MVHSWVAFDVAKKITERLFEGKCIQEKDILHVRGIIQITLEEENIYLVKTGE